MTDLLTTDHSPLAGDLLSGVRAIADFLGEPERRTHHLIATDQLPGVFKLGGRYCARKSTIMATIQRLERGEAA